MVFNGHSLSDTSGKRLSPLFPRRSKDWANECLRAGVHELRNEGRVLKARLKEVRMYVRLLHEQGFWWQRNILRYHLHLYFKKVNAFNLQSARAQIDIPLSKGGGS